MYLLYSALIPGRATASGGPRNHYLYRLVFWTCFSANLLYGDLGRLLARELDNVVVNLTLTGLGPEPMATSTEEVLSVVPELIKRLHGQTVEMEVRSAYVRSRIETFSASATLYPLVKKFLTPPQSRHDNLELKGKLYKPHGQQRREAMYPDYYKPSYRIRFELKHICVLLILCSAVVAVLPGCDMSCSPAPIEDEHKGVEPEALVVTYNSEPPDPAQYPNQLTGCKICSWDRWYKPKKCVMLEPFLSYLKNHDTRYDWNTTMLGTKSVRWQRLVDRDKLADPPDGGVVPVGDDLAFGIDTYDGAFFAGHGRDEDNGWEGELPYWIDDESECTVKAHEMELGEPYAEGDLEWFSLLSCHSLNLYDAYPDFPKMLVSWLTEPPIFRGVHGINGFDGHHRWHNTSYQGDDLEAFAEKVTGFGGHNAQTPVSHAWSKSFRHKHVRCRIGHLCDYRCSCPVTLVGGKGESDVIDRISNDTFFPVSFPDVDSLMAVGWKWWCVQSSCEHTIKKQGSSDDVPYPTKAPVYRLDPPVPVNELLAKDAEVFGLNLSGMRRIEMDGSNKVGYVDTDRVSVFRSKVSNSLEYMNLAVGYQHGISLADPISDKIAIQKAEILATELGIKPSEVDWDTVAVDRTKITTYDTVAHTLGQTIEISTTVSFYRSLGGFTVYSSIFMVDFSNEGKVESLEMSWRPATLLGEVELRSTDEMREETLALYSFPSGDTRIGMEHVVLLDSRLEYQEYLQPIWLTNLIFTPQDHTVDVHVPAGKTIYPDEIDLYTEP